MNCSIPILNVLRYALFNENSDIIEPDSDVVELLNESVNQSVYTCIYTVVKNNTSESKSYENMYYQLLGQNIRNQHSHERLHELLTDAKVAYVVLKGMASARYYPDPCMRTMGDVDFLVKREDVELAASILREHGFTKSASEEHGFHTVFTGQGTIYELHWAAPGIPNEGTAGERARYYLKNIIDDAEFHDGYMVPSDFHHGIVLLLHSASHMTTTGMGLRHLCDWAVFVNRFSNERFTEMFEIPLKEIGLWEFAKVLTAVSVKYLGIESKNWAEGVENETVDLVLEDIMAAGNFGIKDGQRINQAKLMRDDATRGVARDGMFTTLVKNINVRAKRTMPICSKVPLLLPFGWILVGTKYVVQVSRGKRKRIKLRETIKGAESRGELYSRLRLFEGVYSEDRDI